MLRWLVFVFPFACRLFNHEGALIAHKTDRSVDDKLFAAIVANVWKSVDGSGASLDSPEELSFFIAEFEVCGSGQRR